MCLKQSGIIDETEISPSATINNLGVTFGYAMTMSSHVTSLDHEA